jgi:signal transduction histidine kinase
MQQMVPVVTRERAAEEQPLLLSALPPSRPQARLAAAVAALLLVGYGAAAPFADIHFAPIKAFIPVVDTLLFLTDVLTAVLLFAQFSVLHSRALQALASGYLFTGLLIVPHGLTFPDAFSPTGLLGATLQTNAYLYIFWHFGLPSAAIAYARLRNADVGGARPRGAPGIRIVSSIVLIVLLVCALTWLATAGVDLLPTIMVDALHSNSLWDHTAPFIILLDIAALVMVWRRRRSVLDLWLLIALWAWLIETVLLSSTNYRFTLVWYAGRIYGMVAASFVLLALLAQTTTIYTRLAISIMTLRREREYRLMALDAALALVGHEVNQPLSAVVANGGAGLRELEQPRTDVEELKAILRDIVSDGHRASDVIGAIRTVFKRDDDRREPVNLNDLVTEALAHAHGELQHHEVAVDAALDQSLPRIVANKIQLQQVLANLITNAIEAMDAMPQRSRLLSVQTRRDAGQLLIRIADSGPGIAADASERIFEPFFTTKTKGSGLGLAISRSIVAEHGGRLWATPAALGGTAFQFTLPLDGA